MLYTIVTVPTWFGNSVILVLLVLGIETVWQKACKESQLHLFLLPKKYRRKVPHVAISGSHGSGWRDSPLGMWSQCSPPSTLARHPVSGPVSSWSRDTSFFWTDILHSSGMYTAISSFLAQWHWWALRALTTPRAKLRCEAAPTATSICWHF